MNMNLNLDDEDDDDDEEDGDGNGDGDDEGEVEKEGERVQTEVFADEANNDVGMAAAAAAATTTAATFNTDNEVLDHEQDEDSLLMMQPGDILSRLSHKRPQKKKAAAGATATVGLTSDGNEAATATAAAVADTGVRFVAPARNGHRRTRANNQHKKHKSPKGLALSTLLCEGYNIEQRNCNSFECSGKCNEPFNANNG